LGIRRYRSEDRAKDFFRAWSSCLESYALHEKVDFVLIAGDLFDARKVEPQGMNHAMAMLVKLREVGIPVIAIEGNHDSHETQQRFSWLRSLSKWGYLKLLEPVHEESGVQLLPWDEEKKEGSFIDLGDTRIFGSIWYGATTSNALPGLVDQIRTHHDAQRFNIMLLHTDVEGQLNRPIPALPVAKINELKSLIDYLALGHIHKNFEIDGWVFNPGSLEACNVDEYFNVRGAYLVEIVNSKPNAQLMRNYFQRPIKRLTFEVGGHATPEALREALFAQLKGQLKPHDPSETDEPAPVIELALNGHLGFKANLLELPQLRDQLEETFRPLLAMLKNQTVPVEYAVAAGLSEHVSRAERERRVIEDLISCDARFAAQAPAFAHLILEAKRLTLGGEHPSRIVELLEQRLEDYATQQPIEISD
jgi:DNA repair exonuclease SbcCD nuclease subunit